MYKNVIIIGARKSGKSTLAKLIAEKEECNIVNLDDIVRAFEETFPKEDNDNYKEFEAKFINNYINILSEKSFYSSENNTIFEGNVPNLKELLQSYDEGKISIIGLTYNNIESKQFANDIKEYSSATDMYKYLPIDLIESDAKEFIEENKNINELLIKNGISSFDVSENRVEILDEIVNNINHLAGINSVIKVKN